MDIWEKGRGSCYRVLYSVAQASLKLRILLPQPPKCQYHEQALSHLATTIAELP